MVKLGIKSFARTLGLIFDVIFFIYLVSSGFLSSQPHPPQSSSSTKFSHLRVSVQKGSRSLSSDWGFSHLRVSVQKGSRSLSSDWGFSHLRVSVQKGSRKTFNKSNQQINAVVYCFDTSSNSYLICHGVYAP